MGDEVSTGMPEVAAPEMSVDQTIEGAELVNKTVSNKTVVSKKRKIESTQDLASYQQTSTDDHRRAVLHIVKMRIPSEIADIDELLSTSVCRPPTGPLLRSKARKPSSAFDFRCVAAIGVDSAVKPLEVGGAEIPQVQMNDEMLYLLTRAREKLLGIIQLARDLKRRIWMLTPKMESENFGAEVQGVALELTAEIEKSNVAKLLAIPAYYTCRTDMFKKVEDQPDCIDAKLAIAAYDITELDTWKMNIEDIKSDYEKLAHVIDKNMSLVLRPLPPESTLDYTF